MYLANDNSSHQGLCGLFFDNNIAVDSNIVKKLLSEDLTIRNAPVGGHTCITAGEQGEPAVVLYERINLSVFVPLLGGRAKNLRRGYQEDPQHLDMLQIALTYPVVVGPPTGTDRETQLLSLIRRFTAFTSG